MALSVETSPDRSPLGRLRALIRRLLGLRPVRFLLVGGLNTLFGYALFTAFYLASHMRQPSLIVATVVGALFNFFTTGKLVFGNRGYRALIPFVAGYAVVLAANMALLEGLARAGVSTLLAQAVALPFMVLLSYVVNRYMVFARPLRDDDVTNR